MVGVFVVVDGTEPEEEREVGLENKMESVFVDEFLDISEE